MKKWLCTGALAPDSFAARPTLGVLQPWLKDPGLYRVTRHSIAGAFAIGLALMWVPLPVQTLLASLFAIQLRVNLPLSASLVWITNPLTIPPMYYGAYQLGTTLTGTPSAGNMSWQELMTSADALWVPLATGCGALALLCAVLGYVATHIFWRLRVVYRMAARKSRQRLARCAATAATATRFPARHRQSVAGTGPAVQPTAGHG